MPQKILDGTLSKQQYEYKKNYPGQGGDIYFNTYQVYERTVDQPGVIDQGTLNTYQLVKKGNDWYKGAELGVDGKWKALTEKESGILVPNSDISKPGTFKPIPNASDNKVLGDIIIKDLNAGGRTSLRYQSINNAKFQLKKAGGLTENQVANEFLISNNLNSPAATQPDPSIPSLLGDPIRAQDSTGSTQPLIDKAALKTFNDDLKSIEKNQKQKEDYEDVIYPVGLRAEHQDCIKFSIIKYKPSGLKNFGEQNTSLRRVTLNEGKPNAGGDRSILATIVLPIPGGISDNNQVVWSGTTLNDIQQAFGKLAQTGIMGEGIAESARKSLEAAARPGSGARTAIISRLTQGAIGAERLMQRQFGTMINPNLELLLDSPYLRQFAFSFKLSPRSTEEAIRVKKIIRNFKQAMSVKRATSSFLLQTPHTFAISYVFKNRDHPYLNRFKECALTSCSVNYTPEGNYMSFDDPNHPSMVSYQVDLQFQELEPVFDDDYGNGYENIGY
jgi:hypothetical protein